MRRLPATAVVAAAVVVATMGVGAGSVLAAGTSATPAATGTPTTPKAPASLSDIQAKAAAAISARVTALNAAIAKVQAAKDLGGDQAALVTTLQADVTGLQQLAPKIAADTTVTTARSDAELIFANFRVFALALPVSRLVVSTDRINATAIPKLTASATKLAGRVNAANSAQVTPLLNDLNAQVAAAASATKGVSAQLLSLTPAAWNTNQSVLDTPRAAVKTAVGDLKKAAADRKQIVADLRGAKGAGRAHSTTTPPTTGA